MSVWSDTYWVVLDVIDDRMLHTMEGAPKMFSNKELASSILTWFIKDTGKDRDRFRLVPVQIKRLKP